MRGCGAGGVISLPVTGCRRRGMNQPCRAAGNRCWRSRGGCGNSAPASFLLDLGQCRVQGESQGCPGAVPGCSRQGQSCHGAANREPCGDAGAAASWERGVSCRACDAGVTGLLSIWQPLVLNEGVSANTDPNYHSSSTASSACSPQVVRCSRANASISFPWLN